MLSLEKEFKLLAADGGNPVEPKKNAFGYFVNMLFPVGVLFALASEIADLGTGRKYPYQLRGIFSLLLAGCAVSGIYRMNRSKLLKLREEKKARQRARQEKQSRIEEKRWDEEELRRLRMEAMQSKFDTKDALKRGMIHITATEGLPSGGKSG